MPISRGGQNRYIQMKIKSFLAKPFASYIYKGIRKGMATAVVDQENILKDLIKIGRNTEFGKQAGLDKVNTYEEFKQAVSIRDYEQFRSFIDLIKEGKHNVLWKGRPIYFAKTSGTTSGTKYIPITKDSIPNHINTAPLQPLLKGFVLLPLLSHAHQMRK